MHSISSAARLCLAAAFRCASPSAGCRAAALRCAPVQPFFKTYCLRCHDEKKQKGEFRLDTLPRDFTDQAIAQRWGEVVFRMNSGEMPPKKEPQPKPEELGKVVDWISTRIKEGEAARMARRGPVAHYRLSREEYGHTVYDLLGVYFDVNLPGAFNEDPRWHGFDRIGSLLSLSPSHVDRYFRAAETVLDRAFPDAAAEAADRRARPPTRAMAKRGSRTRPGRCAGSSGRATASTCVQRQLARACIAFAFS